MYSIKKKRYIKRGVAFALGMVLGFAYYALIGCDTGTCRITGNPYISTLYGGVLLLLIDMVFERNSKVIK